MVDKTLTNPFSTAVVSDYRTGRAADGFALDGFQEVFTDLMSGGAIAYGDLCILSVPTATTPPRVVKGGAAPISFTVVGIAVDGATAAGQPVAICKYGFCHVNVGAGAPVIGDMGVVGATAGQVDVIAAATGPVAADVLGKALGQFMGTKDANSLAWFFYNRV